ncbi:MAG: SDR family NAD(P)-dependent oxidoreductase [Clostridium sp.]|nr:SDR family NAD(P)-dependent oxidoreductase [Clostridium sp.]
MKKIVVMGATSGIGLRVAVKMALLGWKVGAAGRNADVLKRLKEKFPEGIEVEEIDVTKAEAPGRLGDLIKKLGGMDAYLHVSGVGYENPRLDPAVSLRTVETNVTGFVRMIDAAYSYFRDFNPRGHIAAITSVAGTRGIGQMAAYCSSKKFDQTYLDALEQLANSQGLQLKFTDIRPGWVRTPLIEKDRQYMMCMSADKAADGVVKAMQRQKRSTYLDCRWRMVAALMRAVPQPVWKRLNIPLYK